MKKLLQAVALSLLIGTTTYAGDIPFPPAPADPPPCTENCSNSNSFTTEIVLFIVTELLS